MHQNCIQFLGDIKNILNNQILIYYMEKESKGKKWAKTIGIIILIATALGFLFLVTVRMFTLYGTPMYRPRVE